MTDKVGYPQAAFGGDTIRTVTLSEAEQAAFASGWNLAIEAAARAYATCGGADDDWDWFAAADKAILDLSMPTPAQAWRVKPLEWTQGTWSGQPAWFADCPFGCWSMIDHTIHGNGIGVDDPTGNLHEDDYPTLGAAKAAAQADYAARILAALIPDTEGR